MGGASVSEASSASDRCVIACQKKPDLSDRSGQRGLPICLRAKELTRDAFNPTRSRDHAAIGAAIRSSTRAIASRKTSTPAPGQTPFSARWRRNARAAGDTMKRPENAGGRRALRPPNSSRIAWNEPGHPRLTFHLGSKDVDGRGTGERKRRRPSDGYVRP
jgi:hypothetical protein